MKKTWPVILVIAALVLWVFGPSGDIYRPSWATVVTVLLYAFALGWFVRGALEVPE